MKTLFYASYFLAASLALLGGCAVYVPTIPSTPLVEAGQVEITAGLRGLNSLEAGAAWSPVPHLLLSTEAAWQPNSRSTTVNNVTTTYNDSHRQVGFGVGAYRAPTARLPLYLAAVGGLGFASMDLHSVDVGVLYILPVPVQGAYYQASYRRYYGQLYAAYKTEGISGGVSVRGTWVDYTRLLADGLPIAPAARFFLEPTLFLRTQPNVVQVQGTLGISAPTGRQSTELQAPRTAPVSLLIGVGIVFRPDMLGHRE
ncbi:hypothetical protein GCM10027422_32730 [Hymenobacter arcticus]